MNDNCKCKPIGPRCKVVEGLTIVVIPAQSGSSAEGELYAPKIGDYHNAIVKYLADGLVYAYDKDGNWTLIADYNAITPTIDKQLDPNSDNPVTNRAITRAINELEQEIENLATVAKTGDYDDLINKPVIDTELDDQSTNAVTNAAITTAINEITSEIDRPVLYDLEMASDANNVTFTEDKIDVVTGETTQETDIIPSASATTAGTISADEYTSIKNSQDRLDALEGGSVAVSGLPAAPTQAQLTTAWLTETGETELINRASIYDITNTKVWTYYSNTQTWYEVTAGAISVNPFTNSTPGTILGSTNDGAVSANLDGTGSVSGWSALKTEVSGKLDPSDLDDVAFIDDTIGHVSDTAYVGTANIQANAVTTAKIADLNVTTGKLASNSVTTAKIADDSVTSDKIDWATINAVNYSMSEQVIGTWVDGNPLYRKVVDLGNLPNAAAKNVATGLTGTFTVVSVRGSAYVSGSCLPIPYTAPDAQYNIAMNYNASSNILQITTGSNRSSNTGIAIIEYTRPS